MKRALFVLLGGTLAIWAVAAALSESILPGQRHAVRSGMAWGICVIPTTLTLILSIATKQRPAEERLMVVLLGVIIRMGLIVGAGVCLHVFGSALANELGIEWLGDRPVVMWVWLLFFYLVTLVFETTLVLRAITSSGVSPGRDPHS